MSAPTTTPPVSKSRRRVGQVLVVLAAGFALFTAGWGMWHYFQHQVGIRDWYMVLPMFLLFDFAGVACAWNARINRLAYGRIGVEGWLVWLFASLSGLMSASDAQGVRAVGVRFAAPLVAAILFELLIRGERKDATGGDDNGAIARLKRRLMARLGLLDALELDDAAAARASAAGRIATLAYRVHQTPEGSWRRRRAVNRYHRRLRSATERFRFATDTEMIDAVRAHLAAQYQSVSGTAESAVADLNLWRAADAGPVRAVVEKVDEDAAALCELVRLQARQARTAVTAEMAYRPSLLMLPTAPPMPVDDMDALVVATQGPNAEPVKKVATVAGHRLADEPPVNPPRKRATTANGTAKKVATDNATRIAKLRAKQPAIKQADVVAKTGISARTVSRYWADTTPATEPATAPVNGHAVPNLITTTD